MSDSAPALSSYFTFSGRNLVIHGASAAATVYFLYRGELDDTSRLARAISDLSQAVLAGANVWHTHSSMALFRRTPRHTFAAVQTALFPDYFTLLHGVSGVALAVYLSQPSLQHHHCQKFRVTCLFVSYLTSAANATFLGPTLAAINNELIKMEKQSGVGNKEGKLAESDKNKIVTKFPAYETIHGQFSLLHGLSMLLAFSGYVCNLANIAVTGL